MSFHLFLLLFSLLPSVPCEAGANNASSPFSPARVLESDPDLSDCSTLRPGEEFHCPSGARCDELDLECLTCRCPLRCGYGRTTEAICKVREGIPCHGERTLRKPFLCHYCFQVNREGAEKYDLQRFQSFPLQRAVYYYYYYHHHHHHQNRVPKTTTRATTTSTATPSRRRGRSSTSRPTAPRMQRYSTPVQSQSLDETRTDSVQRREQRICK